MVKILCPVCGYEHPYAVGLWEGRYIVRETYCARESQRRRVKIDSMRRLNGFAPLVAIYKTKKKGSEDEKLERVPKCDAKIIGKRIKDERKKRRMSQKQLASKLYFTREAVSLWETGKNRVEMNTLKLIADALDVDLDILISA